MKHDHARKASRPTFLNSQCWVTLALVVRIRLGAALTVPIRSWLVEESGQRWGIEPLFHNVKRWWGVTNLWQHSKPALELWMQIRCAAYALMQLLALTLWASFPLMEIAPWRKRAVITAGLFGQWMRIQFIGLRVRSAFDLKSENFVMPFLDQDQRLQC